MSCQENKYNFTSMFPLRIGPLYVGNSSLGLVTIVGFVFFRDVFFGGRICSLESSSDRSGNTNGLLLTASYNVWIYLSAPKLVRSAKGRVITLNNSASSSACCSPSIYPARVLLTNWALPIFLELFLFIRSVLRS